VASAETGRRTFEAIIEKMVVFCREFHAFVPPTSDA
jgi:creatinine amidohydrolase/Fe(II)-dependent formamide hydrolase-like protein